ncbi:hypothetical protein ACH5RR_036900 [Cinchona calisaya]|uniref:Uncharacterized protein n=1 Tax=Cinchona calisaya TaxID=153742 RepID=A0ABD2Y6V5_9GENT
MDLSRFIHELSKFVDNKANTKDVMEKGVGNGGCCWWWGSRVKRPCKMERLLTSVLLQELEEMRNETNESARIYKDKTKTIHDKMISTKHFITRQKVLLFHCRLKFFTGKLCSRWVGLFVVTNVFSHGAIEIRSLKIGKELKVSGHRLKSYYEHFVVQDVEVVELED